MRSILFALVVALPIFAGCVEPDSQAAAKVVAGTAAQRQAYVQGYVAINPDELTPSIYKILPMATSRVKSSLDGLTLFAEIHRPETQDRVPTILHSSPYNGGAARPPGAYPAQTYPQFALVQEYVPRGYAVVVADVRGFGESEGCVEVWGKNEQQDQYDIVEWIAAQPWSDGKVGMIGVSYPGTTPMEAAVMAPPHLTTIVAVAGLTDPYFDWHYGGVPNGESVGSPAAYQQIGVVPPIVFSHGVDWAKAVTNAGCGTAELVTRAYQTDGRYTDYYKERNLSARVKNVEVPVLYTQGFIDGNVKPSQLLNWFNALDVPKKGIFGQWAHRTPPRSDWKDYVHAWFDEHLKGYDTGIMSGPTVEVITNLQTWRPDTHWPPLNTITHTVHLDAGKKSLGAEAPASSSTGTYRADRVSPTLPVDGSRTLILLGAKTDAELHVAGVMSLDFHAAITGDSNTFFYAEVFDVGGDGVARRVAFGALNAALRDGLSTYKAVPEGQVLRYHLEFQPREWIVEPGHQLRLVLSTPNLGGSPTPEATRSVQVMIHSGPETPSRLSLPILAAPNDQALPPEVAVTT